MNKQEQALRTLCLYYLGGADNNNTQQKVFFFLFIDVGLQD
jgi:hypothetical protein